MSQERSPLVVTTEDLKPWIDELARLYMSLNVSLGFDEFLRLLTKPPRSVENFTSLLQNIALRPEALWELVQQPEFPPANDWVTASQIVKEIGNPGWVQSILRTRQFVLLGELRKINQGQVLMCFPPTVVPTIRELIGTYPPADEWLNTAQIAKEVGRSTRWVQVQLETSFAGIGEQRRTERGQLCVHYSPTVISQLRELALAYPPAGDWLTINEIAAQVSMGAGWVSSHVEKHFPNAAEKRLARNKNHPSIHYPRYVITLLQELVTGCPPVDDWMNIYQIASYIERSFTWVEQEIEKRFAPCGHLRRDFQNKEVLCYPPLVVACLRVSAGVYSVADGWLTIRKIAKVVPGRSEGWVRKYLEDHHSQLMQLRYAENGHVVPHYPPHILVELQRAADTHQQYPLSEDWLTLEGLALQLQRSPQWITDQLKVLRLDIVSELRRNPVTNTVYPHYPPLILDKLRGVSEKHPKAEGWMTACQLAREIRKSDAWVTRKLKELFGDIGELRRGRFNKLNLYFPPEVVIPKLVEAARMYRPAEDWATIPTISKALSRKVSWVQERIRAYESLREMRLNHQGSPCWHYPPSVVDELRKLL